MLERSPDSSPAAFQGEPLDRHALLPDLGNEPPLDPSGLSTPTADRRAVSVRWLSGSILTGISGVLLLGAAIYVSLESDAAILETPEIVSAAMRQQIGLAAGDRPTVSTRKADRLVRFEVVAAAKQTFKSPMTMRAGDREVIKVRPFVRLATALSSTVGQYASDVPPFNPLKLFADDSGAPERAVEPEPDPADAEVSIVKRDLASTAIDKAPALSDGEVAAQIEEDRRSSAEHGAQRPALPLPPQLLLSRSLQQPGSLDSLPYAAAPESPFSKIEVRVVPENVTVLPKVDGTKDPVSDERVVTMKRGETLEQVLRAAGGDDDQIRAILKPLWSQVKVSALGEGQRLRILVAPSPALGPDRISRRQIVRVMLLGEKGIEAIAALDDRGTFVAVAPPQSDEKGGSARAASDNDDEEDEDSSSPRLYESLYETGLKNSLPVPVIEELVRIFAYDVDFQRHITSGDSLEVFYGEDEEGSGRPEILYAALTTGGEQRRIYRYQSDEGAVEFFDQDGKSLKKFLLRKPISEGELRSGFGMRYHPILHYSKMHTGVDWANKIGTPILAAGNGVVTKAGWSSGYGRHTEIQHANGYVTTYSHQSAFARGINEGARVRQGQVIGYLGSSGLSTGPHLHYEVLVNGRFVNPLRIKVPRGRELDGRALADFKRQREQIDQLLARADTPKLAQTGGP
ncbi:M23 family metallopeptidase [Chelatococcus reniformis]|nr:M23 family metallopeptidase [Chelatococcus reniformis]